MPGEAMAAAPSVKHQLCSWRAAHTRSSSPPQRPDRLPNAATTRLAAQQRLARQQQTTPAHFCSGSACLLLLLPALLLPNASLSLETAPGHPLDPLSGAEVSRAAESCRAKAAALGLPPLRFNTITLQVCRADATAVSAAVTAAPSIAAAAACCDSHRHNTTTAHAAAAAAAAHAPPQEPPKEAQLAYDAGRLPSLPRVAFCILQTPPEFSVIEALVDLRGHAGGAAVVSWTTVSACAWTCSSKGLCAGVCGMMAENARVAATPVQRRVLKAAAH